MNAENTRSPPRIGSPDLEFHTELTLLLDEDGHPQWDGEAEIHVRAACSLEVGKWERERAAAVTEDDVDENEARVLVFLIPVSDEDREDTDD